MLLLALALLQATGRTTPAQEAIAPRLRLEIVFDGTPMYPNAIAALVSTVELFGRSESSWPTALHNLIVGRALGRALAHEIGHFLLRTRYHSPTGLMRALQPITSLVAADRLCFTLSPDEVTRLGN